MDFSFFHISDIHFHKESTSGWISRNRVVQEIKRHNLNADCLVISGDLFHHGCLNANELGDYKCFLSQLPGSSDILVVPGNHDVDRSAQERESGSYNIYKTRRNIVFDAGESVKNAGGEFTISEQEKKILYNYALSGFQSFSKELGFRSFSAPEADSVPTNYEIQIRDFPIGKNRGCSNGFIRFVLLNTALIAGQSVRGDEYRKRKLDLKGQYGDASERDPVVAAEIAVTMTKQIQSFEDYGEIIIDEETHGEGGRLSLSRDGNRILSNISSDGAIATFFVGHHGLELLASETRESLKSAMERCRSGIYLCGHAHKARYTRHGLNPISNPRDIEQFQAGAMFSDKTGFAQYGFNRVSLSFKEKNISIDTYFIIQSASGESYWAEERVSIELPLPENHSSKGESENTEDTKIIENIHGGIENTDSDNLLHPTPGSEIEATPKKGPASTEATPKKGPASTEATPKKGPASTARFKL